MSIEVKLECLGLASANFGVSVEEVVEAARSFYDFVTEDEDAEDDAEVLFADDAFMAEEPNSGFDSWSQGYDDGYEQATRDISEFYEEDCEDDIDLGDWGKGYNAGLSDASQKLEMNLARIRHEESEED